MSYPDPPKTKNLTIRELSPQLRALFDTFVELEQVDPKTLLEGMLYDWCQKFMESRAKEIDVDPEIFEALEEGIEQCFRSTVLHRCLYKPIDSVPEHERDQVLAKMVR
ncbi:hypothetical protein KO528_11060 [Saccharophagus degradans]|uniref:hypothetical protein n=1 Tax=Saccharophagus degradans TaxID=86304 RepID=UPI001C0A6000|nr:hypothetical protein [Saccharophagus degradans]MBU2985892.1 hypothetical protein [Saccharophagus degradans]